MAVQTIRNATGARLRLWGAVELLADLADGQAVHDIDPMITRVTRGDTDYPNRHGAFQNNDSYLATFIPGGPGHLPTVLFTGNHGNVSFT